MPDLQTAPIMALTVKQPYASAIAYGDKRVENRTWTTAYRGLLAIHAGRGVEWDARPAAWTAAGLAFYDGGPRKAWRDSLPLGVVIAVADLTDIHPRYRVCNPGGPVTVCTPWSAWGQCHWVLGSVRPLAEPVPCKGALGLWRLPPDAEKAVRERLEVSRA